ncbi:hypothetical protein ACFFK0_09665 [Paenibacillus chartarius]|uniref:Uncharacterized protein n=1 Tax=Paenibacillus chartarius TaxID=747481 RepID=A0ABV6DJC4_9BACL
MRKLILFLFVLVLILTGAAGAVVWYVQPTRALDLQYEKLSVPDKIAEMVQRRTMELRLTEADMNNLIKASMAGRTNLPHDLQLTGVSAEQQGELLIVDANVLWRDAIAAGTTLTYRMSYSEPDLILTRESVRIKGYEIPPGWLQTATEFRYNLYDKLPKLIGIQGVAFGENDLRIGLKLLR